MTLTPREKLVIIYRESTRAQRLRQATKLGFTGKPENKLRSYRRLIQTDLTQTQKFNVTSYFKPYVTQEDFEEAWNGQVPPFKLQGRFVIVAYGIGIFKDQSTQEWEVRDLHITPKFSEDAYSSSDITRVFEIFQNTINELFENPQGAYEVFGISFNRNGFNPLLRLAREELGEDFAVPGGITEPIGAFLRPTKVRIVDKKPVPYTPARQFPKRNRAKREAYINRAFGQLTKEGGRLSEYKTSLD